MNHRIRLALHHGSFEKMTWEIEADETFIGGKARNMHNAERKRRITGRGAVDKTAVLGFLKRGVGTSKVRTFVVEDRKKVGIVPGPGCPVRPRRHQPRREVRRPERARQRDGELLVPAETGGRPGVGPRPGLSGKFSVAQTG